jgi:Phage tail protein (Tail_P2_I)
LTYTRVLFDRLPDALKAADEAGGVISHITRSIQPQLDIVVDRIETEEYIYDVDLCPPDMLDWLGQLVGLATVEGKYLGLGLNPLWPAKRKREVIARAWVYWQISGTNMGIREGLALWLDWAGARDPDRLEILMPLEDLQQNGFDGWWGWKTGYGWNLLKKFSELRKFGNGNDFSRWSLPAAIYTPLLAATPTPAKAFAGMEPSIGSALGLSRPWMHCYLKLAEWNEVVTNIRELNPEIWAAEVEPVVFAWLDFIGELVDPLMPLALRKISIPAYDLEICEPVEAGFTAGAVGDFTESAASGGDSSASVSYICRAATTLFELRPTLKLAASPKNWRMFVSTAKGTYEIAPLVMFFINNIGERSATFDLANFNRVYLEFLFAPIGADAISKIEIYLEQIKALSWDFAVPAQIRPSVYSGFKAAFQLGDGAQLPTVGVVLQSLPTVGVTLVEPPTASVFSFIPATDGTVHELLEGSPDIPFKVAYFYISLAGGTNRINPISVSFSIGGNAEYGTDWHMYPQPPDYSNSLLATPYTEVSLRPDQSSFEIAINITTDALIESDEFIELTLIPNPDIILDLNNSTASITILDDDTLPDLLSISAGFGGFESSSRTPARITVTGNNIFAGRLNVSTIPAKYRHDILNTADYALEPGEPSAGGFYNGSTVWWHWTAPSDMLVAMDLYGSGRSTIIGGFIDQITISTTLAVYTGSTLATLVPIATGYDYSSDLRSYLWFQAVAGTNYKIQAGTAGQTIGSIFLNVRTDISTFTISRDPTRTQALLRAANANFIMDGAATRDRDYILFDDQTKAEITSNSLNINQGTTSGRIIVQFKEDAAVEPGELVRMTLVPSPLCEIESGFGVAGIVIDDNSPLVSQVDLISIANLDTHQVQGRGRNVGISNPQLVDTNRLFANSYSIPSVPADYSHTINPSLFSPNLEPGEPTLSGYSLKSTAWWSWTATFTGHVSIGTYGSSVPWANYGSPVHVSVYTGNSLSGLVKVSAQVLNSGDGSDFFFFATVGTTYRIQVGTLELTAAGTLQIHISRDIGRLRIQRNPLRTSALAQNLVVKSRFSSSLAIGDDYVFCLYNASGQYDYPRDIYSVLCAAGSPHTEILVKYIGLGNLTASATVTVNLYEDREYQIDPSGISATVAFGPGAQ